MSPNCPTQQPINNYLLKLSFKKMNVIILADKKHKRFHRLFEKGKKKIDNLTYSSLGHRIYPSITTTVVFVHPNVGKMGDSVDAAVRPVRGRTSLQGMTLRAHFSGFSEGGGRGGPSGPICPA